MERERDVRVKDAELTVKKYDTELKHTRAAVENCKEEKHKREIELN